VLEMNIRVKGNWQSISFDMREIKEVK
jgi:hypothetical protein